MTQISPLPAILGSRPFGGDASHPDPASRAGAPAGAVTAAPVGGRAQTAEAVVPVRELERAAALLHRNRPVEVSSYRDDSSSRLVIEVRDSGSGDVVAQYPADELLRFYASVRADVAAADNPAAGLIDVWA